MLDDTAHRKSIWLLRIDYKDYEKKLPVWREKIFNLLDLHRISLLGNKEIYLIEMEGRRRRQGQPLRSYAGIGLISSLLHVPLDLLLTPQ